MGRQLARNVYVDGQWYRPGDTPPAHVAERITNPKAWAGDVDDGAEGDVRNTPEATGGAHTRITDDGDEAAESLADLAIPAKSGPGSGKQAWWQYAERNGVTVPEDPSRDDIIDACEAAGVPTE